MALCSSPRPLPHSHRQEPKGWFFLTCSQQPPPSPGWEERVFVFSPEKMPPSPPMSALGVGLPHIPTGEKSFQGLNHTACLLSLHFPVPRGRERVPTLSPLPAPPPLLPALAGGLTGAPVDLSWCWELIKPTGVSGELSAHPSALPPSHPLWEEGAGQAGRALGRS